MRIRFGPLSDPDLLGLGWIFGMLLGAAGLVCVWIRFSRGSVGPERLGAAMLCFVQPLPAFLVARTVFDGGLVDLTMLAASGIIGWAGWVVTLWDLGKPEP